MPRSLSFLGLAWALKENNFFSNLRVEVLEKNCGSKKKLKKEKRTTSPYLKGNYDFKKEAK